MHAEESDPDPESDSGLANTDINIASTRKMVHEALENVSKTLHCEWHERREFRTWAAGNLSSMAPPAFHSAERERLKRTRLADQERMLQLLKEVESIHDAILQATAIISPIRLIPPEILSRIFQMVAMDLKPYEGQEYAFVFSTNYPSHFARHPIMDVCRQWRAIAAESSALWGKIEMDSSALISTKFSGRIKRNIETWISLSQHSLLDIKFEDSGESSIISDILTKTLRSRISHWVKLYYVCYDGPANFSSSLFASSHHLPRLKSLRVEIDTPLPPWLAVVGDLVSFPALLDLILIGPVANVVRNIDAPNLQTLTIYGWPLTFDYFDHISRVFCSLQTLDLTRVTVAREARPRRLLSFPRLESLNWDLSLDDTVNLHFFGNTPTLVHLRIAIWSPNMVEMPVMKYVTTLQVAVSGGTDADVVQLLAAIPNLCELKIILNATLELEDSPPITETVGAILQELTLHQPPLCPKLSNLILSTPDVNPGPDVIIALSKSRQLGYEITAREAVKILRITLDCNNPLPKVTEADYFQLCEAMGVDMATEEST